MSETQNPITPEMTVAEALERVPGADGAAIFERHGVNPWAECGPRMWEIRLEETPSVCHVDDLDALLGDLRHALAGGARVRGGQP